MTFQFKELGRSELFNAINKSLFDRGVYHLDYTITAPYYLTINSFTVIHYDLIANVAVRLEGDSFSGTLSELEPYLVLSYVWKNKENNEYTLYTKAPNEIELNDIILGRIANSGNGFDTTKATIPVIETEITRNNEVPTLKSTDPLSTSVLVSPGVVYFNGKRLEITTETLSPTFNLPVSSIGRTDVIGIDYETSNIRIVEGSRLNEYTIPNSFYPLALINFTGLAEVVQGQFIQPLDQGIRFYPPNNKLLGFLLAPYTRSFEPILTADGLIEMNGDLYTINRALSNVNILSKEKTSSYIYAEVVGNEVVLDLDVMANYDYSYSPAKRGFYSVDNTKRLVAYAAPDPFYADNERIHYFWIDYNHTDHEGTLDELYAYFENDLETQLSKPITNKEHSTIINEMKDILNGVYDNGFYF